MSLQLHANHIKAAEKFLIGFTAMSFQLHANLTFDVLLL